MNGSLGDTVAIRLKVDWPVPKRRRQVGNNQVTKHTQLPNSNTKDEETFDALSND